MRTIKSKLEFNKVFSKGTRANHRLLRITHISCEPGDERLAFVAAKRLGNAVYRNRCKRVLREAARSCGLPVSGHQIILFATDKTHDSSSPEVAGALASLLSREHIG